MMHSLHISVFINLFIRSVVNVLFSTSSFSSYNQFHFPLFVSDDVFFLLFSFSFEVNCLHVLWELNATQDLWDWLWEVTADHVKVMTQSVFFQSVTSCPPIQSPLLGKDWVTIMPSFPVPPEKISELFLSCHLKALREEQEAKRVSAKGGSRCHHTSVAKSRPWFCQGLSQKTSQVWQMIRNQESLTLTRKSSFIF